MQAVARLAFGPWLLDPRGRSLSREGARVDVSPYQYQVLHLLVLHAGEVLSKEALIHAGWRDTAVGDNSLEKLIGQLRRRLDADDAARYIRTCRGTGTSSSRLSRVS